MQSPNIPLVRSAVVFFLGVLGLADVTYGQGLIEKHWVCNAYGSKHDHPDQCSKPAQGGQWVYGSGGGSVRSTPAAVNISAFQQRLNQNAIEYRRRIRQQMADDIARDNKRIAAAGSAAQARLQSAGNAALEELAALDAAEAPNVTNQQETAWSIDEATKAKLLEEYGSLKGDFVASLDQLAASLEMDESIFQPNQIPSDDTWFSDPTAWPPDVTPPSDADLIPPDLQTSSLSVEEVAFLENQERMKDRNGDGFSDELTDAEAGLQGQRMRDRNGDGRADELTDRQAKVYAQQMKDRDGDGRADEMTDNRAVIVAQRMRDRDGDGRADEMTDSRANVVTQEMRDRDGDGRADEMTDSQAGGVAQKMKDRDGDGRADEMTDGQAEVGAQTMKDRDGDGFANEMTNTQAEVVAQQMKDRDGDSRADEMTDNRAEFVAEKMKDRDGDGRADELTDEQAGFQAQRMKDRDQDGLADQLTDSEANVVEQRMKDRDRDGRAEELTDKQADILAQQMKDRDRDGFADERTDAQAKRDAMKQQIEGFAPRKEESKPSPASETLYSEAPNMTSSSTSPENQSSELNVNPVEKPTVSEIGLSPPMVRTEGTSSEPPSIAGVVDTDSAVTTMDGVPTPGAESAINRIADERFFRNNPDLRGQPLDPGTLPQKSAEWLGIRDEVAAEAKLNGRVDQIFWERRPEFAGRRIDPTAQPEAAREWLSIRDQLISEQNVQIPVRQDTQVAANTSRSTSDTLPPRSSIFTSGSNVPIPSLNLPPTSGTDSTVAILRAVPVTAPDVTDIVTADNSGMKKPERNLPPVAQKTQLPLLGAGRTTQTTPSGSLLPVPSATTDFWSNTKNAFSSGQKMVEAAEVAGDTAATYSRYQQKANLGVKVGKQITVRSVYKKKTLELTNQARARGLRGTALMVDVNARLAKDPDLKRLNVISRKPPSWGEKTWFATKATVVDRWHHMKNYAARFARGAAIEEAKDRGNAIAEEIGIENEGFANTHMLTRYTYNLFRGMRNPFDLESHQNMADALWMRVRQAVEKEIRNNPDMDPGTRSVLESLAE